MKTLYRIEAVTENRKGEREAVVDTIELIVEERYMAPLKEATVITINGTRYTKE